jgi:hypothetical protein
MILEHHQHFFCFYSFTIGVQKLQQPSYSDGGKNGYWNQPRLFMLKKSEARLSALDSTATRLIQRETVGAAHDSNL